MLPARSRRVLSVVLAPLVTIATAGLVLVAGATPASASSFVVGFPTDRDLGVCNNPSPSIPNPLSLREALCLAALSPGANTVQVPSGTYQLTLGPLRIDTPTGGQTVTVLGSGNPAPQIVGDTDGGRVLAILGPTSGTVSVSIDGLTLRNGRTLNQNGAGLAAIGFGGTLNVSVSDTVISNNNSSQGFNQFNVPQPGGSGAGIAASDANLSLTRTTVSNNTAGANSAGGLLFASSGTHSLNVTESQFSGNSTALTSGGTTDGGAILVSGGLATISNSTFTNNSAAGLGVAYGGGVASVNGTTTITRSTFTGNAATGVSGGGGAVSVRGGSASLSYNRMVSNTAPGGGSAVLNSGGTVTAQNNWWGCNAGPGNTGCSTVSGTVTTDPRLTLTHTASPSSIAVGGSATLTASMRTNSAGTQLAAADFTAFNGVSVAFGNAVRGSLSSAGTTLNSSGTATATFTGTSGGAGSATATVDSQSATANIAVTGDFAPTIVGQPTNEIRLEGSQATFTAAATGSPSPTVQWEVSTNGGGSWDTYAGATSTTLSISTDLSLNGNLYRAVFTNSLGSATTNIATLTVLPLPSPTVTVEQAAGQADPTSTSPIEFTVTFSENVTGLTAADVDLSASTAGGTLTAAVTGGPDVYTISVSGMTTAGNVVVNIPANVAVGDVTGKDNVASTSTDNSVAWAPPAKQSQTITFGPLPDKTFGDPAFPLTGSASSGLPVTYTVDPSDDECSVSGSTVTILHAGVCAITATQAGDDTYDAAAPVTKPLVISPRHVDLIIDGPPTLRYGTSDDLFLFAVGNDLEDPPASAVVTSLTPALCSVGLTVGGGHTVEALAGSGTCTVFVDAPDTRDILYSSDSSNISLAKGLQTITFTPLDDQTFGAAPFDVTASASSGLGVSFAASGQCTVSGATVTLTAAGSCTITASQAGNDNYEAARDVSRTFNIAPAFTLGDPNPDPVQYSDTLTVSAEVGGTGGTVAFSLNGTPFCSVTTAVAAGVSCAARVNLSAGTYDLDATLTLPGGGAGGTASGSVRVTTEDAEVAYTGPLFVSTGSATATTAPVTLTGQVTQAPDGLNGDLTKAKVKFYLFKSSNIGGTADLVVNGTVAANGVVTATVPNLGIDNWVVIPRFDASAPTYFDGPDGDAMVLTVYAPTTGIWATGGGWVTDPSTGNIPVAIDPANTHGNFGFNVRYKSGTTPQGQSVYVFHGANGYDYIVKSNSWRGGGAAFATTGASFSGKAAVTVFDPVTSTVVSGLGGGNFSYRVDVRDGTTDTYAISVYDSRGKLFHQVGTTTSPLGLNGGNITIHAR